MDCVKIIVYVPNSAVETVKQALFDAGAGTLGNYDKCCWQTQGIGQFRPNQAAKPSIGSANNLEQVTETRVEMICKLNNIGPAITALKLAHPYEEPAYDALALLNY